MNKLLATYQKWRGVLLLAAVVLAVLFVWSLVQSVKQSEATITVDDRINITPEQIESIKAIGEWEFLSVADEELVDTTRKGFFSDDHLVRIYYGTLRLGINMHQVEPGWLTANGDSISVRLPKPGLLSRDFIDEARTRVFHESGRWGADAREALYRKAYQQMLDHCLTADHLRQARQNGEAQFLKMMRALGYEHVSIRWEE